MENKNSIVGEAKTVCKYCNKGRKEGRMNGRKEKRSIDGRKEGTAKKDKHCNHGKQVGIKKLSVEICTEEGENNIRRK